jgi:ornithine--oxo-acid transaminase
MLGLDHWGLEPDLITVAKSLSGGYVPVGALLMAQRVFEAVFDSMEHSLRHGSTFAPNDLAMVAGLATLRELRERGLVERSAETGRLLLERTLPLVDRYEVVRDVRGLGLMWAIEFSEPRRRRTSWRLIERVQAGLFAQLVVVPLFTDHRVLIQVAGHRMNIVRAMPPLVLSEVDVDSFAAALDAAIAGAQKIPRAMVGFAIRAARA